MTDIHKKYRLTSMEEPTDEMLHALMEDVAAEARKSKERAEAEKNVDSKLLLMKFLRGGQGYEREKALFSSSIQTTFRSGPACY